MIVIADKCGRLGNRIWTYANLLAFGYEHGIRVLNPGFIDYRSVFRNMVARDEKLEEKVFSVMSAPDWALRLSFRCNLKLRIVPTIHLDWQEMLDLDETVVAKYAASKSLLFVTGMYFIAKECLLRHADEIRNYFLPGEHCCDQAVKLLVSVRQNSDLVLGIHIRQGDYRTYCDGLMYYDTEEYALLMHELKNLWPNKSVAFVVCSDEVQSASPFRGLNVTSGLGTVMGDLYTLSLCDYIIGPSSTYSRWASFAGSKPLWRMDWKAAIRYQSGEVCKVPSISDFAICFTPSHIIDENRLFRVPLS